MLCYVTQSYRCQYYDDPWITPDWHGPTALRMHLISRDLSTLTFRVWHVHYYGSHRISFRSSPELIITDRVLLSVKAHPFYTGYARLIYCEYIVTSYILLCVYYCLWICVFSCFRFFFLFCRISFSTLILLVGSVTLSPVKTVSHITYTVLAGT